MMTLSFTISHFPLALNPDSAITNSLEGTTNTPPRRETP